jgi:hypothetical protein
VTLPVPPQRRETDAEDATLAELRRRSWVLLGMLAALALLVVPLVNRLTLGPSPRYAILAWLLVALALYWFYAGMGFWPLLIIQLMLFSAAAALLTIKVALVVADVERLPVLRHTARVLLLVGSILATGNLVGMLRVLFRRAAIAKKMHPL